MQKLFIIVLIIIPIFVILYLILKNHSKCIPSCSGLCNGESNGCGGSCGCQTGKVCNQGSCVNVKCTLSSDCLPGQLCQSGNCTCDTSKCSAEQSCQSGICTCDTSKCPSGQTCQSGTCKYTCSTPCEGNKKCIDTNTCGYICNPACTGQQQCIDNNTCCVQNCDPGQKCKSDGSACVCDDSACTNLGNICSPDSIKCIQPAIVAVGLEFKNQNDDDTNGGFVYVSIDKTTTWTRKKIDPNCRTLNGVAFDGVSSWVTVGDNGVYVSNSPQNQWLKVPLISPVECTGIIWVQSKNMWVITCHAGNTNTSCIYYSTTNDIQTLIPTTTSPFETTCTSITFNVSNSTFIALGHKDSYPENSSIKISTDLNNWITVLSDSSVNYKMTGLACNSSNICLAMYNNLKYSINGGAWSNGQNIFNNGQGNGVACNDNGFFIAFGATKGATNTSLWYSTDGQNWSECICTDDNRDVLNVFNSQHNIIDCNFCYGAYTAVPYGKTGWFVIGLGENNSMVFSPDGINFKTEDYFTGGKILLKGLAVGF